LMGCFFALFTCQLGHRGHLVIVVAFKQNEGQR